MNGLPYYKRYPRDFIEGTIGLPFELKVTYSFLLDLVYVQSGKLPDDPRYIAGLLGVSVRKWNALRQGLIDAGKIVVDGEHLTNYRALSELESLAKLQDKQRENRLGSSKNNTLQKPRSDHTEPEPDIREEAKASSPRKRGTRLPQDWVLPRGWGEWAVGEGYPEAVIRIEAEKFRDFWISKAGRDGVKLDWQAVWRNWLRNAKTPKIIKGDGYGGRSRNAEGFRAFISGAD